MALSILNDEKVRTLAHVIRYQEADAINVLNFSTEAERSKYLKDSKWNYDTILALLDSAAQLKTKLQNNSVWGPIADDFLTDLVYCANIALQTVPNYLLRIDYLKKVIEYSDDITNSLNEQNSANANELAEEVLNHKTIMSEYLNNYRSTASLSFSQWIQSSGISFEQLVQRYQAEVGYQGPFKDLQDEQKIMVYERIIQASGRGSVHMVNGKFIEESGVEGWTMESKLMSTENRVLMSTAAASIKKMGKLAIAGLLFTAGNMTWDIYTAADKITIAARDAVVAAASKVGGALVEAVVTAAIVSQGIAIAESVLVTVIGTVTGFVGGFIIGAFAGFLFDLFFSSGGGPLSTEGLVCYVAIMPDGVVLARQIAHQP